MRITTGKQTIQGSGCTIKNPICENRRTFYIKLCRGCGVTISWITWRCGPGRRYRIFTKHPRYTRINIKLDRLIITFYLGMSLFDARCVGLEPLED